MSLLFVLFALFFGWGVESEGTGWTNYAPLAPPTQLQRMTHEIPPPLKGPHPQP